MNVWTKTIKNLTKNEYPLLYALCEFSLSPPDV
jgi:hypothetical protein